VEGLVWAVDGLLDDAERRAAMDRACHRRVEESLAWDRQATVYLGVFGAFGGRRRRLVSAAWVRCGEKLAAIPLDGGPVAGPAARCSAPCHAPDMTCFTVFTEVPAGALVRSQERNEFNTDESTTRYPAMQELKLAFDR
jgi:hypothetical protein